MIFETADEKNAREILRLKEKLRREIAEMRAQFRLELRRAQRKGFLRDRGRKERVYG